MRSKCAFLYVDSSNLSCVNLPSVNLSWKIVVQTSMVVFSPIFVADTKIICGYNL